MSSLVLTIKQYAFKFLRKYLHLKFFPSLQITYNLRVNLKFIGKLLFERLLCSKNTSLGSWTGEVSRCGGATEVTLKEGFILTNLVFFSSFSNLQ